MSRMTLDFSHHPDPAGLMRELQEKYHDPNVTISLKDDNHAEVIVDPVVPLQMEINILSFLNQVTRGVVN